MVDKHIEEMFERADEFVASGLDLSHATSRAKLESNVRNWPEKWGNSFHFLLYGDFSPPTNQMRIEPLGITIQPEPVEGSVVTPAMCVLRARIDVPEQTVSAVLDAIQRINIFLGAWTLVEWGNGACGWWSQMTCLWGGGIGTDLDHDSLPVAIASFEKLPTEIRKKINAALYWIREPRSLMGELYRSDTLRRYAGYWNAFECLVDAVLILVPKPKLSKSGKQTAVDKFFEELGRRPKPADIIDCYQQIVNPGFVGKATHAINHCFGDQEQAAEYVEECFHLPDKARRLYDIRNAINHGDIDAEHPDELARVSSRMRKLWLLVWHIFGQLIAFPYPVQARESSANEKDRT